MRKILFACSGPEVISNKLRENEPLEITSGPEHANRIFLIPAYRVHYVVCDEVERPMDRRS